jgi:uncharacterized membrane protein YeaQ/YmgE (transglycosylase-associated protein family)
MVAGIFTGWLVAAVQEVDEGVLSRMGVGLLGGLAGGITASVFSNSATMGHITLIGVVCSIVGALILLGLTSRLASTTDYEPS